jgi:hypothetical protein
MGWLLLLGKESCWLLFIHFSGCQTVCRSHWVCSKGLRLGANPSFPSSSLGAYKAQKMAPSLWASLRESDQGYGWPNFSTWNQLSQVNFCHWKLGPHLDLGGLIVDSIAKWRPNYTPKYLSMGLVSKSGEVLGIKSPSVRWCSCRLACPPSMYLIT